MYESECFTAEEVAVLERHFTSIDGPVFALLNLPEVVKGALFARYSRTAKSLRRLFLDEFVDDLDAGTAMGDSRVGVRRAEALYDRVFLEYGDDSVAQLGGVHLGCEQASNVLTKVLEWGRLMSYLEQSTRYVGYDTRLGGNYRYFRDPAILASHLRGRYLADMDEMFRAYATALPAMTDYFAALIPQSPDDSSFVYRQAIKAKALDAVRGMLPAAALSNLGIYGSGQGYENLLLRMHAHAIPEVRDYADMMLTELRKVIPSFLKRVDLPSRGVAWSDYLRGTRNAMAALSERVVDAGGPDPEPAPAVSLVSFDPDGEVRTVTAALYPHIDLPESQLRGIVEGMSTEDRLDVLRTYTGDRTNRRHKPGRALEAASYRFDVLCDYGAFRDLQRHRLMTIDWQQLTPTHGYTRPESVALAGIAEQFDDAMATSASLYGALAGEFPAQAAYAVSLAHRIRFVMQMNAREAMHIIELRSTPQGHPAYRRVAQEMHRLIRDEAGHRAIAEMMRFVDMSPEPELERLASERAAARKRDAAAA